MKHECPKLAALIVIFYRHRSGEAADVTTGVAGAMVVDLIIVFTQASKIADQWQTEIICTPSIIPT